MPFRRVTSLAAAVALSCGLAVACADDTEDPIDPEPTEVAPPIDEGTPNNSITGDGTEEDGNGPAGITDDDSGTDDGDGTGTGDGAADDS